MSNKDNNNNNETFRYIGTLTHIDNSYWWRHVIEADGTQRTIPINIDGTKWRVVVDNNNNEPPKYYILRGRNFLNVYNQIYFTCLNMEIGPIFYYGTIRTAIL